MDKSDDEFSDDGFDAGTWLQLEQHANAATQNLSAQNPTEANVAQLAQEYGDTGVGELDAEISEEHGALEQLQAQRVVANAIRPRPGQTANLPILVSSQTEAPRDGQAAARASQAEQVVAREVGRTSWTNRWSVND